MYEWLTDEIALFKTRDFHQTSSPRDLAELRRTLPRFPESYLQFLARFGRTLFFRENGRNNWAMGILGLPERVTHAKSRKAAHYIGWVDDGPMGYFDDEQLAEGAEARVCVSVQGVWKETDLGFDAWLDERAQKLRKRYGKRAWQKAIRGPAPFTERELAVVDARLKFEWRVLGITEDGQLRFEVTNRSDLVLPWLSLGVRAPGLQGGMALPLGDLAPGATKVLERECYRGLVEPADVEVFDLPAPEPESRGEYWDFGDLG